MSIKGILKLTIYEAQGLTIHLPSQAPADIPSRIENDVASSGIPPLPYALIDYDKSQVVARASTGTPDAPIWIEAYGAYRSEHQFDVARPAVLRIQLYLPAAASGPGGCADLFLGSLTVFPSFEETEDALTDWLFVRGGTGAVRMSVQFLRSCARNLNLEDFDLVRPLYKRPGQVKIWIVKYVIP